MPTVSNIILTPRILNGKLVSDNVIIPSGILFITLTLNLQLADKLANDLFATLTSEVSPDSIVWNPLASFGWTSYGPGGYTSKGVSNPDPRMRFSIPTVLVGQFIRVTLDLPQSLIVGATIDITT